MARPSKNYSTKKVANIKLEELRKFDWWLHYENGPKCHPRTYTINKLKELFPAWKDDPTFNFHWDKQKQYNSIKLYVHVPKVNKVEVKHETAKDSGERQGTVQAVSNAVLRHPPVLD